MQTWYRVAAAAIGWFVIGLQYYLTVGEADGDFVLAATRLLSFFTILTNILVALAMTLPWLAPESKLGAFFLRPSVRTAIACYIIIVSAVYYAILRKLWNPEGLQYLADTIEHCVAPALYIVDWLVFVPKGDALGKVGPLVAALSRGLRRRFVAPRRGNRILSLSLPRGRATRLRARVAQHGRAHGGLCRARPHPCRHRPPAWIRRTAQGELTRVNSLGICWPQDRPRRFGDAELSRARETARKGLESMHHPDHRGQKAVPAPVASVTWQARFGHFSRGQAGAGTESEAARG
jgi:hypothetical protein